MENVVHSLIYVRIIVHSRALYVHAVFATLTSVYDNSIRPTPLRRILLTAGVVGLQDAAGTQKDS